MFLPSLVGLFFVKWSVFEITRTSANFEQYSIFYIHKFEIKRQGVISNTFKVLKKQEGPLKALGPKKFEKRYQ
jgi:hypothetical protein